MFSEVDQFSVYIYPLLHEPPSHPPQSHPSRSSQSIRLSLLCYTAASHQSSISHMVVYIHNATLPIRPLFPLLCPHVHSLHLCLYFCSANRFICTIFLDFIHTCSLFPIFCLQAFPSSPLLTTKSSLKLLTVKFLP